VGGFDYAFNNSTNLLGITTVPEPSTWALLGLGALAFLIVVRGRQKQCNLRSSSYGLFANDQRRIPADGKISRVL
jgi:hypothetical protein